MAEDSESKAVMFGIRMTVADRRRIEEAAAKEKRKASDWARLVIFEAIEKQGKKK